MNIKLYIILSIFMVSWSILFSQPANDDPCDAVSLIVGQTCSYTNFTNASATSSGVASPSCGNYNGGDIWFQVIAGSSGNLTIDTDNGSMTDAAMAAYTGTCNSLTQIDCDDDGSSNGAMPYLELTGLTPGATIWIRIWEYGGNNNGSFSICVYDDSPPDCQASDPADNQCVTATHICNLDGYCGNTSNTYNALDPNGIDWDNVDGLDFCGSIENNSWLSFTAGSNTAVLNVWTNTCQNDDGIQMEIYSTNDCQNFTSVSNCHSTGTMEDFQISANGLVPGETYYLMIDGYGGDVCDYVIQPQSGVMTVEATADDQTLCTGQSTQLTASGGTSYSWTPTGSLDNPNIATPIATPAVTTTYTVSVTGGNPLCPSSQDAQVIIYVNELTYTTDSTNVTCNGGNNGSATITVNGGTDPITYAWSDGQTTQTATGLSAGSYSVTATDAEGCSVTATVEVLEPAPMVLTTSATDATCGDANGTASVDNVTGGTAAYSYAWNTSPVQTTQTANGLLPGNYTVTVSDANNCTQTATITVPDGGDVAAGFNPVNNQCQKINTYNFVNSGSTGGGETYAWNFGDGNSSNLENPSHSYNTAGTYTITQTVSNGVCTETSTQTITVYQDPELSLTSTDVQCQGVCDGAIDLTVSNGQLPYSYSWDNGSITEDISGLCNGNYTAIVTDANGCKDTISATISQPTALSLSVSKVDLLCNNICDGTATANPSGGTPPYAYSWNTVPVQTNQIATGLCAQSYDVTVTDANGCTQTQTVSLTEPTAMVVTTSADQAACGNSTGQAHVDNVTGGSPGYLYAWNTIPVQNTQSAIGLAAGSYQVTVTDVNGCETTETVNVSDAGSPTANITSSTDVFCYGGNNGTATVQASGGGGGYQYSWSNGDTGPNASGLSEGTYTVTVTDINLCTASASVVISEPTELIAIVSGTDNASCNGAADGVAYGDATGGTGPYSYSWSTTPVQNTQNAVGLAAGNYTLTVSDAYGCSDAVSFSITDAGSIVTTVTPTHVSCNSGNNGGANLEVTGGTAPFTYLWSNGTNAQDPVGLAAGTYQVTVTDANGCSVNDSAVITQPTAISASANGVDLTCNNVCTGTASSTVSGGTHPYSYSWNTTPIQTNANATNLCAGLYTLTITDANNCTQTTNVTINQPTPLSVTTTAQSSTCGNCNGQAVATASGGTGPYSFSWSPNGGGSETATGLCAGTYVVTVTDANNCMMTDTVEVTNIAGGVAQINSSTNVTCYGLSNGYATAGVTGGTPPFSYQWSTTPAQNTATATGLGAGVYQVSVTDGNGCVSSENITITAPTAINIPTTTTNPTCFGYADGEIATNVTGGTPPYSYSWNTVPTQNTADATNISAGNYTVTVTDANGCQETATAALIDPQQIQLSLSATSAHCNQSDGSVSVIATNGTAPYFYNWNTTPVQNSSSATNISAGSYTVTVTDQNSCTASGSVSVNDISGPNVTISFISDVSCNGGGDGEAIASVTDGTPPYSYQWNDPNNQTSADASQLPAGSYAVDVYDAAGCHASTVVDIDEPTPINLSINSTQNASCFASCDGNIIATASGGTPNYTYLWNTSPAQTNSSATGLCAGTYTVTVTDDNGCSETNSSTVNQPNAIVLSVAKTDPACSGSCDGQAVATATGGLAPYSYQWNTLPVQNNATAYSLCSGVYMVTSTDANGCTSSKSISLNDPIQLTVSLVSSQAVSCNGECDGRIEVGANGGTPPYAYQWDDPASQTSSTATGLCAGTYTVTVTDANGCSATYSAVVSDKLPITINATVVDAECYGYCDGTVTLNVTGGSAPYTYQWNDPDMQITAEANGLCVGNYTVMVTDTNDCTQTANYTISQPNEIAVGYTTVDAHCGQPDGSATVTVANGIPPFSYLWDDANNQNTQTATGLAAGTYQVIVTDATTCSNVVTVEVSDLGGPKIQILSHKDVSCYGADNGSVTVSVWGGTAPYTYQWNDPNNQTTASAIALPPGCFNCVVTDSNDCVATKNICIEEPDELHANIAISTNTNCNNGCDGTATVAGAGGNPPYVYQWNDPDLQTTPSASGLCTGTYIATIKDSTNCVARDTIDISQPQPISITITPNTAYCNQPNGSATGIVTGGTPPYLYSWNTTPVQSTSTAINLSPGLYTLTVIDANGCTKSKNVTIPNKPAGTASIVNLTDVTCYGNADGSIGTTVSGATPPLSYQWNDLNNQTTTLATGLVADDYTVTVTDANGCVSTATGTVSQPQILTLGFNVDNNLCNGLCQGVVTASASGGIAPYSYSWNDPNLQTSPTASGLCAGKYSVMVSDSNNCFVVDSVTVTEPVPMIITKTVTHANCGQANGSIAVSVTNGVPPYSYLWSSGQTTSTINNVTAGSYTVTVTDKLGCTEDLTVIINDIGGPDISLVESEDVTCFGDTNGYAMVSVSNGTPPYTGLWNDQMHQTLTTAVNLPAGVYTYTVTDNAGCVSNFDVTINEPNQLVTSLNASDPLCFNQCNGRITASSVGGTPPYTYSWDDPNSQSGTLATGLCAGTYNVEVYDANNCPAIATVELINPQQLAVSIIENNENCYQACDGQISASVANGTAPFTYIWDDPSNQTSQTALNLCAGNYNVQVTDVNGCQASGSGSIDAATPFVADILVFGNASCYGQCNGYAQVSLTGGQPPFTYQWDDANSQTAQTAVALCAGDYSVTVTDANGCIAIATITITQPQPIAMTTTVTDESCFGSCDGSATVSASGGTPPYSYLWDDNQFQNTATAANLCAASFQVRVTDSKGCNNTKTVVVGSPPPLNLNTTTVASNCGNNNGSATVSVSGGTSPYSYQWNDPYTQTSATAVNLVGNNYIVVITDANGCIDSVTVGVNDIEGPTVDIISSNDVDCYGNANGSATVSVVGGVSPYSISWNDPNHQTTTIATGLSGGVYSVLATDANNCVASDTVSIYEPLPLNSAIVQTSHVSCYGGCDGESEVAISGGNGAYTMQWNDTQTQASTLATGLCANQYMVTITDAKGCITTSTVNITQPDSISIDADIIDAQCYGANDGSAQLNVSGGTLPYIYNWSPNVSNNSFAGNLQPNTYTVIVIDQHICSNTFMFDITQPTPLNISTSTSPATCSQCNGSGILNVSGGTLPYDYYWQGINQTGSSESNLCPGDYFVRVTDSNNCTVTVPITVNNMSGPIIDSIVTNDILCPGGSNGSAMVSISDGTPPLSYLWTPSNNQTSTPNDLVCGVNHVRITDANGCVRNQNVIIDCPSDINIITSIDTLVCADTEVEISAIASGGTPPYSYIWNHNLSDTTHHTVTVSTTETYTVYVQDANGCLADSSAAIILSTYPAIDLSILSDSVVACEGDTVTLQIGASGGDGGPYTYTWNTGDTTSTISIVASSSSSYNVTVLDGCGTLPADTTIHVSVYPKPNVSIAADSLNGCMPHWVSFSAIGDSNINYLWYFGDGQTSNLQNPTHVYVGPGTYDVTVVAETNNGCSTTFTEDNMITVYPHPEAEFSATPVVASLVSPEISFDDMSVDAAEWHWNFGDPISGTDNLSNLQNPTHIYSDTGSFTVQLVVFNAYGCSDTAVMEVYVEEDFVIYIPNSFTPDGNNLNEEFKPEGVGYGTKYYEFYIFNRWGQELFYTEDVAEGWNGLYKNTGKPLPAGVYVWLVKTRDNKGNMHRYVGHVNLIK